MTLRSISSSSSCSLESLSRASLSDSSSIFCIKLFSCIFNSCLCCSLLVYSSIDSFRAMSYNSFSEIPPYVFMIISSKVMPLAVALLYSTVFYLLRSSAERRFLLTGVSLILPFLFNSLIVSSLCF